MSVLARFWDQAQATDDSYKLSGYSADFVLDTLRLDKPKGRDVLVIGVGRGYETEYFHDLGWRVCALDISKLALKRVEPYTAKRYLPNQFADIASDSFDLIISHLVAQHMNDTDLADQLKQAVRTLKSSGLLAIQFAISKEGNNAQTEEAQQAGTVLRSLGHIRKLVRAAGGKITLETKPVYFKHAGFSWCALHIVKAVE